MRDMRSSAATTVRIRALFALVLTVTLFMILTGSASAANPCAGQSAGSGVQDPPGSGIWYQCVLKNPNTGNDTIAVARPDWPEVPAVLLWPASALAAFGVYLLIQRRRAPQPLRTR